MSSGMNNIVNALQNAVNTNTKKGGAYDTSATVTRIDGNTVWVHIPGGVDETPAKLTVNAAEGDTVQVRVSNGRAFLIGNATSPPTDDTQANKATKIANKAQLTADTAIQDAERARDAADSAQASANLASAAASRAQGKAEEAAVAASNAQTSANNAATAASNAQTRADQAATAASNAQTSADSAFMSANAALNQLGIVEDVVGVLTWASEHGDFVHTTDTTIQEGKVYFTYDSTTGDYTPVVNPVESALSTYYELSVDEAMDTFIMSHLAVTQRGLWVLPNGLGSASSEQYAPNYKVLLANDGMYVYDGSGNLVSTFGENITFSSSRAQYIGGENAYIVFNPQTGSLTIGGNLVTFGSGKTLSEVLSELSDVETAVDNTLIYDHTYEIQNGTATFTAYLYRGGVDIKSQYDPEDFTWYYKTTDGELQPLTPGYGYTQQVDIDMMAYGGHIVGRFTSTADSQLLDENDNTITNSNDIPVTGRTESGETIRLSDFSVATTLFSSEKILIVGAEDEHLITIQTLQDYLNANLNKQVKFNTTANWDAQTTLVSDSNTLYVYTDHETDSQGNKVAGIKAGDGLAYVVDLPFTDSAIHDRVDGHIANTTVHVSSADRSKWDNKVRCYYAGTENLVFTTS